MLGVPELIAELNKVPIPKLYSAWQGLASGIIGQVMDRNGTPSPITTIYKVRGQDMERFHRYHGVRRFVPRGGILRTIICCVPSTLMVWFFSFDQFYSKLLEKGFFETLCAILVFYLTLTAVLTRVMVKQIAVSDNSITIKLLFSEIFLDRRGLERIFEDRSSHIIPVKKTLHFYLVTMLFFAGIGPADNGFWIVGLYLHKQFFNEEDRYGIDPDVID